MKKIKIIMCITLIAILLVSCNTKNLEEYKNAVKRTDEITKAKTSVEFSLIVDVNSNGLNEEEIKNLNYIKDLKGSFNNIYDVDEEKFIYRNYLNFGGLGFDFDIYGNKDEVLIKLPIVGKYINLDQIRNTGDIDYATMEQGILSEATKERILSTWIGLMNEEDVFKGKNIIVTTPDGEVKATEYHIKLSDEQIKMLSVKFIEIISDENNLKEFYDKYIKMNNKDYISFVEMINNIKEDINIYNVEKLNYSALVDIDGYIVSENIDFSIKILDSESIIENISFSLEMKSWDINKKQDFEFPTINRDNLYNVDDLSKNMPNIMDDFLKQNK